MSTDGDSAADVAAADELRLLSHSLRQVEAAATAVEWDDTAALSRLAAEARVDLDWARSSVNDDPAVVAVERARAAVAEAVLTVAEAVLTVGRAGAPTSDARFPLRRTAILRAATPIPTMGVRIAAEIRHVAADKPRSILIRLAITLAISLSLVAFYHLIGWASYDNFAQLVLYLFSAVVGSVVCTNALCFEAGRVRHALTGGQPLWQILVAKNLAMAALVTAAGLPVIVLLTVTADVNPISMLDQLITMVFIWLGVGNVMSVVYPLRHEPISARLRDGTWRPYLVLFAVSYGVGLTVNLMIYWRLWARQTAATQMVGGVWTAFVMVLLSSLLSWILLTVLAVACSRDPQIRRLLSREMVVYRKSGNGP